MTTVRIQPLAASTGALAIENERLRREHDQLLEKKMVTETNTDDMIRKLKTEVDAEEARLAEKRTLLERAEQQRQTLARDAQTARAKAHDEAVAACKSRLAALMRRQLDLIEHAEQLAQQQLDTRKEILKGNAELRAEACRLGRSDVVDNDVALVKRMSLRESKTIARTPGCRFRFGYIELPSGAFGTVPDALTWREDEQRYHRDLAALIEQEG